MKKMQVRHKIQVQVKIGKQIISTTQLEMYGRGPKRRAAPAVELVGVAVTTSMALAIQLRTAATAIRTAAATTAFGSRPTLIIK